MGKKKHMWMWASTNTWVGLCVSVCVCVCVSERHHLRRSRSRVWRRIPSDRSRWRSQECFCTDRCHKGDGSPDTHWCLQGGQRGQKLGNSQKNCQYCILTPKDLQQLFWVLLMLASSAVHHLIQVKLKCAFKLPVFHLLCQRLDEFHRIKKKQPH